MDCIKAVSSTKDGMLILLDTYHQQWIRMDEQGIMRYCGKFWAFKIRLGWLCDLEMNESFWALIFEDQVYVFDVMVHIWMHILVAAGQSAQLYDGFLYSLEPGQPLKKIFEDFQENL